MIAKAKAKYIRMSPTKVRQVVNLVRGKYVNEAFGILSNINKSATLYVKEILQSAVSNAKRRQQNLNLEDLYISRFTVDGGPTMVRYRAASMGRAVMIRRRTSHLDVELDIKETQKRSQKAKKLKTKT